MCKVISRTSWNQHWLRNVLFKFPELRQEYENRVCSEDIGISLKIKKHLKIVISIPPNGKCALNYIP